MYTGFTVSYRSSCAFLSSGFFSVSHFPHAPHFSVHGKRSDRGSRKNYTFLIFSYQLLSGNSVERFLTSPDRNLYPAELPEVIGTRTSKGTSHPIACDGCYHARTYSWWGVALLLLSSPIGNCPTFPKMVWIALSITLVMAYPPVRLFQKKLLSCRVYSFFKEPAPHPELNCYRVQRRKNISFHTP